MKESSELDYWYLLSYISGIGYDPANDTIWFLYDIDPESGTNRIYDTEARLIQLETRLKRITSDEPIHLIGFSEGAATIGVFLDQMAKGTANVDPEVAKNIRTAILLEVPKGKLASFLVKDYDDSCLINLPVDGISQKARISLR
ncbi:MAG: hypothetical protein U9N44_03950 [Chloroflexota bacterium]|nr:hypothetical protein [Chloroflexota bacterium]